MVKGQRLFAKTNLKIPVFETEKSGFVVLLIYIYAFYIKKCYFSSATVRNQRNIVIVGGSNHEISLS